MINPERLARWSSVLSRVKLDHEAKSTTGTEFRKAALTPAIVRQVDRDPAAADVVFIVLKNVG